MLLKKILIMREFFKFAFASAVGFIIGSFLLLGLLIAILSAVAFTFGSDTEVSIQESSVLHITFDAPIAERTSKNPFQNLSFTSSQNLKALGLNDILKNIEKAKRDENIKGVFLDLTSVSGAPATIEEIRNAGLYDAIWQAFAVLLPVRTVGVMGDGRTYDNVCALRAVTSTDGMTADIYPFESAFLSRVSTRIINEVKGINRVVYDYTSKPPGTIEWE